MARVRADNDARYALRATFVDDSGSVIETDTITVGTSEDPRITATQISNWDTAYGWGNHASAGYATTAALNSATANSSNWDTAYGWGDHSSYNYAVTTGDTFTGKLGISVASNATDLLRVASTTSYGYMQVAGTNGSDAGIIFQEGTSNRCMLGHDQSADSFRVYWYNNTNGNAINSNRLTLTSSGNLSVTGTLSATGGNSSNWNTAYSWGDHGTAGYLTFSGTTANTQTTTANWNANFIGTSAGMSFRKTSWSYAGNANLTDAGNLTETAGLSTIRWSDGSRNTVLCIAPTTGGSANRVMVYNDQGSSYAPGWREIHTDKNNCKAPSFNVGSCQWQAVTGNYGSMQIDNGATGGYEGYSIGGRAVFMHNNNNATGIYNDVNNHWLFLGYHNDRTEMYHAGSVKGYTYGSGFRVTGNLLATSNVYAYYSDERLKTFTGAIESPLEKIAALHGVYYTHNDKARELGYEGSETQVGLIAQEVKAVMPECIGRAPIDDDGEGGSVSGEDYMTVDYPRLVPLLVEGIKELTREVEQLKEQLNALR